MHVVFLFLSEILSREDERRNTHKRSCSGALDNVSHKNIRIYAAFKNLFVHIQKWSTTTQTLQGLIRVSYSPWQDFDQESRIMSMLLL